MLIDFLTCVVAFALEKHEDWTLLAPLLLQRFYYRQMMYVVLFRALKEAVQGRPVGWRGVEPQVPRGGACTATVRASSSPTPCPAASLFATETFTFRCIALVKLGCILNLGAAPEVTMSVAPRAGNGKITVPDILSRKSHSLSVRRNKTENHLSDGV